ncbi:hypothetical protein MVEN_01385500 [Mycena venus]|uniref:Uncharacterized protein n=1 Tax=Mycena venus TaxID=2733690 RepID=A0A8H7CSG8_9AGAR|nr:hypothetical protein MVEN_01385500 [Mycena venus]
MGLQLPQELIDMILDNIHDDIPSLMACSLAARTFVHSARTHIFKRIEITPPPDPLTSSNPCQRFHKLLSMSPYIAPLVEDLSIVLVGPETSFDYDEDGYYLEERHVTWVMFGRTLSLVLPLLNLKRISLVENAPIDWNGGGDYSMDWNKMGRQLKSALAKVFSSPRLEAVHLRGMVIESPCQLLSIFSEATALKEMSLSRLYFTQRWDQRKLWPESQPWRPQLRSLLVADVQSDSFCQYFVSPGIDLTHVNALTIATDSVEWRNKIMGGHETWTLRWRRASALLLIVLALGSQDFFTANLRTIHVFSRWIFQLLDAILKTCPHDTHLEHIILEGHAYILHMPSDPDFDASIDASVDRLKCTLKTVEIRTINSGSAFESFGGWEEAVHAALPSLLRRGMLSVTETK